MCLEVGIGNGRGKFETFFRPLLLSLVGVYASGD